MLYWCLKKLKGSRPICGIVAVVAVLLALPAEDAQAFGREQLTKKLDHTFTFAGHFPLDWNGTIVFGMVTAHKVISHEGRMYVCAEAFSNAIYAGKFLLHSSVFVEDRRLQVNFKRLQGGVVRVPGHLTEKSLRTIPKEHSGRTVHCVRARTKWQPELETQPSRIVLPKSVWIKQTRRW